MSDEQTDQTTGFHDEVTEEQLQNGPPGVTEILPELTAIYRKALGDHSRGERVRFQLSTFPLPSDQRGPGGEPQIMAMIVLYIEIPGAILGTVMTATRVMQINGQTADVADVCCRELMHDLFEARSQQLSQQATDAAAAAERGEPTPVNGMILPPGQANLTFDDMERAANGWGGLQ